MVRVFRLIRDFYLSGNEEPHSSESSQIIAHIRSKFPWIIESLGYTLENHSPIDLFSSLMKLHRLNAVRYVNWLPP